MMRHAGELGIGKVRFVLDQGFVTQGNCKYMHGKELPFVALILRTGLLNRIAALPRKGRPSGTEAILELKKIKALEFNGKGVYLSTVTAKQKKILAAIGLAPDTFEQHVVSGFSQFLSVS
jgi:predicted PilT family ATPase